MKKGNLLKFFMLCIAACSFCTLAAGCSRTDTAGPGIDVTGKPDNTKEAEIPTPAPQTGETDSETVSSQPAEKTPVPEEGAAKWIRIYEETFGKDSSEKLLMDAAAIKHFNEELINAAEYMVDVADFDGAKTVTEEMLRTWVKAGSLPDPCYKINGTQYSAEEIASIDQNRNEKAVTAVSALRGVVTDRADLRTVPYGEAVLKAAGDTYYDRIQETELIAGMPVWILHESADREYYYVQSYYYRGWVLKTKVAVITEEADWKLFADPENFAVVTDAMLVLGGRNLDMGARFALEETTETGYRVILPGRDENGIFVRESAELPLASASPGYVPFTMRNYYIQAFKYEGTMYGYGGTDGGVDCSSYACAVFRSFGFALPRNSGQQGTIIGNAKNLSGLGSSEKKELLSSIGAPAIIYRPGHVMLWLGVENGECRIIQAPQGGETVKEGALSISDERLASVIVIGA